MTTWNWLCTSATWCPATPWTSSKPPGMGRPTSIFSNPRPGFASSSNLSPTGETSTLIQGRASRPGLFFPNESRKGTIGREESRENRVDRGDGPVIGGIPPDCLRRGGGNGSGGLAADIGLCGDATGGRLSGRPGCRPRAAGQRSLKCRDQGKRGDSSSDQRSDRPPGRGQGGAPGYPDEIGVLRCAPAPGGGQYRDWGYRPPVRLPENGVPGIVGAEQGAV